jgi:two-component system CitB family sensor kinase
MNARGWSLARQLVVLQVCLVVLTVSIEATVGVYRTRGDPTLGSQHALLSLVALTEVALTVGISGSLLVADRVRRQTLGLEPAIIARQYQHHDAMLHAVSEGLLITDQTGTLVLANDEARRLLRVPVGCEGALLADLLTDTELAVLLAQNVPARDQMHIAAGRVLLVSRSPAEVDGKPVGVVTTLRDRTELQAALRELDTVRALLDALRAQAHESANRLQVLVGLVELGQYQDAIRMGTRNASVAQRLSDQLLDRVGEPALVALLLGKTAIAGERGVELRLGAETTITAVPRNMQDVLTVVGNLLDNAIDAAATNGDGWVELTLRTDELGGLQITVSDSGTGIPVEHLDDMFNLGFSTKPSEQTGDRGVGLALVQEVVTRLGGSKTVRNNVGAVFQVRLPGIDAPASTATSGDVLA